jgi:sulfur-oxidizing protein SoxB
MRLNGKLIEVDKTCKIIGCAPVAEDCKNVDSPVLDVVGTCLMANLQVSVRQLNTPTIKGVAGNLGLA